MSGGMRRLDRSSRQEADEPAGDSYRDAEVTALLERHRLPVREVPFARQIFVNRNLRLDKIDVVGFDMDYTLAMYHLRQLEELAFRMTTRRMIDHLGYPEVLAGLAYDPDFVIRGLVVDKQAGNIFKMDRHNHCGRAYHGKRVLPYEEVKRLYREEKIHLSLPRFAWIDTLFALPEACLFAEIIECLEGRGERVPYAKLYDDIRNSIDTVHRDDTLKQIVKADLPRFLVKDLELGPALHKLRSGGKKLFLLTNSFADYTEAVMSFILDGVLPEYPSWKNYFDVILTGAQKPGWFSEERPVLQLSARGEVLGPAAALERGVVYQGGSLHAFERLGGIGGDRVLYVGDHIYGDILRSRKSSLWRTCMIVPELEAELAWLEKSSPSLEEMARLEELRARLDDEISVRKAGLNALDRRLERDARDPATRTQVEAERREMKHELEQLRRAVRDADARVRELERAVELGFNKYWGLTFKEGNENSRFGEQIEDYACIYTSRVSNFVFYSPMQYLRALRAAMPHERLMLRMAPYGEEHAPPAAGARPSKTRGTGADESVPPG
ncbi:haloacid dehalogenase [Anaeromyxobacter diazotrophicus]|uniref:Haloacid dehalogenase n=2 Tax=Anaeromyxobacter diazotrophicus TaxID=2590199 RepID=A0A7I9VLU5_9BACT|nr:haloacid dehalogenase [Anaeromyxobacter diazotrophicus]